MYHKQFYYFEFPLPGHTGSRKSALCASEKCKDWEKWKIYLYRNNPNCPDCKFAWGDCVCYFSD